MRRGSTGKALRRGWERNERSSIRRRVAILQALKAMEAGYRVFQMLQETPCPKDNHCRFFIVNLATRPGTTTTI